MKINELNLGRSVKYNFYDIFALVEVKPNNQGLSIRLKKDRPLETKKSGIYVWYHPDWGYFYVGIAAADNFTERWNKHIQKLLDKCTTAKQMRNWKEFAVKFNQAGYGIDDLKNITLRFFPITTVQDFGDKKLLKKELEKLETRIVSLINPACNKEYDPNKPSSTKYPVQKSTEIINEVPLPPDWDKTQFGPGSTIKQRLSYAKPRSQEVGKGSSRIARIINYEGRPTVLKIAMNKKGIVQNMEEVKILSDPEFVQTKVLIPLIDYDKENPIPTWIQTEFAQEPRTYRQLLKKFPSHIGLGSIVLLAQKISLVSHLDKDKQEEFKSLRKKEFMDVGSTESQFEIFYHYAKTLSELKSKYNVVLDDFNGASNWGIYQDRPVIIDIGLTDYSWEYYRKPRKALPSKVPQ